MVFLLAITSLKRVGDLQALLVASSYLEFSPGRVKVILNPRPGYVPKVPTNVAWSTDLQVFHPPPHVSGEQDKRNYIYFAQSELLRSICVRPLNGGKAAAGVFRAPKKGCPATKQTILR